MLVPWVAYYDSCSNIKLSLLFVRAQWVEFGMLRMKGLAGVMKVLCVGAICFSFCYGQLHFTVAPSPSFVVPRCYCWCHRARMIAAAGSEPYFGCVVTTP